MANVACHKSRRLICGRFFFSAFSARSADDLFYRWILRGLRVTVFAAWGNWPHLNRVQPEIGRLIIGIGVLLVIIGLVVWKVPGAFTWFGKLPGDISVQKGDFSFYFPLASCVLISLILSLLAWLFRR